MACYRQLCLCCSACEYVVMFGAVAVYHYAVKSFTPISVSVATFSHPPLLIPCPDTMQCSVSFHVDVVLLCLLVLLVIGTYWSGG